MTMYNEFEVVGEHSQKLLTEGKLNAFVSPPKKTRLAKSNKTKNSSGDSTSKYEEMSRKTGGIYAPTFFREQELLAPFKSKYGTNHNDDHSFDCGHIYSPPQNSNQSKQLDEYFASGAHGRRIDAATSTEGCLFCQRFKEDSILYRDDREKLKKLRWLKEAAEYSMHNRDIHMSNIDFLSSIEIQTLKWLARDFDLSKYVVRCPTTKNK